MKSKDEIEALLNGSTENIRETVSTLEKEPLSALITAISTLNESAQKSKFFAVLSGLTTHESLEEVGRQMNIPLFSSLMEMDSKELASPLKPLLVGLPSKIFTAFLETAPLGSFENLKLDSASEPLQHHLIAAKAHAISTLEDLFEKEGELEAEIVQIEPQDLSSSDLLNIKKRLVAVYEKTKISNNLLDNMLLLAWNSGRSELIESLSLIKENTSKFLNHDEAQGLSYLLKSTLESVFEKEDSFGNRIALSDDFPALDALACFSLWYIQDYFNVGLLNKDDYENASDEELKQMAQKKLEDKGIKTVSDLKEKGIYSQKILRDLF